MNIILIITVLVLTALAIIRLLRIQELSGELKGENPSMVTDSDNRMQATLLTIGGIGYICYALYQIYTGNYLPTAASEHGVKTDRLMAISFSIIIPVFVITHGILIFFIAKYYSRKGRKATFFAHSNKLEMIWTSVPTLVLTSLIVYGISTWNEITDPAPEEAVTIEIYAKQFDWTARYAGEDNTLGRSGYRLIEGANIPGVDMKDPAASDDKMVKGEIHIPLGRSVNFVMHSRDVIHSAYMPHFRAQMNCVPGLTTNFHFVPTITTADMREELGNDEFNYLLLCNKICGTAHYNMQMDIVVDTPEDYDKWLEGKKTMAEQLGVKAADSVELSQASEGGQVTDHTDNNAGS